MNRVGTLLASGALVVLVTAGASCGGTGSPSENSGGSSGAATFFAVTSSFKGYHGWPSYDVTDDADLAGIHDGSTVTEYINHLPDSGLTAFPVGTIIVKEATGGTIPHELFAMTKHGGDNYNSGLPGWEWFDLTNLNDGTDSVSITWSGFGPPKGDSYSGDASVGCNACHLACNNDGVCATPLNLDNF